MLCFIYFFIIRIYSNTHTFSRDIKNFYTVQNEDTNSIQTALRNPEHYLTISPGHLFWDPICRRYHGLLNINDTRARGCDGGSSGSGSVSGGGGVP